MNQPFSTLPEISLAIGNKREQQTKNQLLRLFEQYPLNKWLYTEQVRIEQGVIPHSHPILTLSTHDMDDAELLLGTYIHEQIHWFCVLTEKIESTNRAMEEFLYLYPSLPVGYPLGCNSEFSNYLHIIVNELEYQGLIELLGAERAKTAFERKAYYLKIHELVVREHEQIAAILARYNLILPEMPPKEKIFVDVS